MARTKRTAAQRRAAVITSYRRVAAKARRAGNYSQADHADRIADQLQRRHDHETKRESARRERS